MYLRNNTDIMWDEQLQDVEKLAYGDLREEFREEYIVLERMVIFVKV